MEIDFEYIESDRTVESPSAKKIKLTPKKNLLENQNVAMEQGGTSKILVETQSFSRKAGMTHTNKKGEPAFSDNWTETSDLVLEESLKDCDFVIGREDTGGHHKLYVCLHCQTKVNTLATAQEHFVDEHQKSDAEKEVIRNSWELMKTYSTEIKDLK